MELYFQSFKDFIAMGGHGFYVWLCYGIVLVALVGQFLLSKQSVRNAKRQLKRFYNRQEKLASANQSMQTNLNQPRSSSEVN